jgi:hypothetical protein
VSDRCLLLPQTMTDPFGRRASRGGSPPPSLTRATILSAQGLLIYVQGQGKASLNQAHWLVSYSSRCAAIWPQAFSAFRTDVMVLIFLEVITIQPGLPLPLQHLQGAWVEGRLSKEWKGTGWNVADLLCILTY